MPKIPKNSINSDNDDFLSETDAEFNIPLFINNTKSQFSERLTPAIGPNQNSNGEFGKNHSIDWEPFVEFGAINKLLTALKPGCLKFTESTESCLEEIIFRLETLLRNWIQDNEKIKDILANDKSLMKCEHCGVISIRRRKHYRGTCKPLERSPLICKTQSYLPRLQKNFKVYDERRKLIQKDEKKDNPYRNITIQNDERYKRLIESDDTNEEKKFRDQKLYEQKSGIKKFDKYSDRPLIEVSAPSRKASNIPRSNARLTQVAFSRKINRRNMENIPKQIKDNVNESKTTIIEMDNLRDKKKCKNYKPRLLNESKLIFEANLNQKSFPNNDHQDLLEDENPANSLNLKYLDLLNRSSENNNSSRELLQNGLHQLHQHHDKHLAKGDCSSFHEEKNCFPLSKIERSYPHRLHSIDYNSLESARWILNEENQSEKSNLEAVIQEICYKNTLKTIPSTGNILKSQIEEDEIKGFSSSSAENLIYEWMAASMQKSKKISECSKSLEKTLQSIGIQTISCSSLDVIRRMKAQITKVIDETYRFADCKSMEGDSNRVDKLEDKISNQKTNQQTELQMSYENPSTISSSIWEIQELGPEHSGISKRQIISEKLLSPGIVSAISLNETTSRIFSMHSNILEGNEEMNWETFEQLVKTLHPTQSQLWKDICTVVKNETKRVAGKSEGSTEVCIEIKSVPREKMMKEMKGLESRDEIAFEMDMTLKDMENFSEKYFRSYLLERKMKKIDNVEGNLERKK